MMLTATMQTAEYLCPYGDCDTAVCTASCFAMTIDSRTRGKYCANEDYDDCPIFLVKGLSH
jgi:hypothetical protein